MGKSFANFMCKKFFHPSSFANIKRVWLAEQRVKEETQKQDDLRDEYERDQDHYNNRQLMGDERVKHGLTFIYEAPKAYKVEDEKETEGKLVWKRATPPAKTSDLTAGGSGLEDGAASVRNVRCVKCNQLGHIPTDRECPMYKTTEEKPSEAPVHQHQLVEDMRRDGYAFKQNVLGRSIEDDKYSKDLVGDDDSDDGPPPEEAFLSSLTKKQKKKLLKKLNRMEKKHSGSVRKIKKGHKKRRRSDSTSSDDGPKKHRQDEKKHRGRREMSSESSDSDESLDGRHRQRHGYHKKRQCSDSSSSESRRHREPKKTNRKRDNKNDFSSEEKSSDGRRHPQQMKSRQSHESREDRKRRDSGGEDRRRCRSTEMRSEERRQRSDKPNDRDRGIKKERSPEDHHRDHGKGRDSSSYDEDSRRSGLYTKRDVDDSLDSKSDRASKKSSHRNHDSKERETPRVKVENDRRGDRRDKVQSERNSKNYSDSRDDRYGGSASRN